jgi:hypothetical protein
MPKSYMNNLDTINEIKSTMVGNDKKILEFGTSNNSTTKIFKKNNCTITQFTFNLKNIKNESEHVDKIISGDIHSFDSTKLFGNEKFDVIIINEFSSIMIKPTIILQQLQNLLEKNGFFICTIPNFLFAPNRINFLNGNAKMESQLINFNDNSYFFTLDTFLLLLDTVNLKISQLNRIKQHSKTFSNILVNNLSYSKNIFDSILKDPESETLFYIVKVEPGSLISPKLRQYLLETFSKNIVSMNINSNNEYIQSTIIYNKKFLEQVIIDKDKHLEQVIIDKDNHFEQVTQEIKMNSDRTIKRFIFTKLKGTKIWDLLIKLNSLRRNI